MYIITALTNNFVIGIKNTIPWKLPKDMLWFKKKTINNYIIMGRKTWESIKKKLPHRKNIVISKKPQNIKTLPYFKKVLKITKSKKKIIIIGGSTIYQQAFKYTNIIYITKINVYIPGDIFFLKNKLHHWKTIYSKYYKPSKSIPYSYSFKVIKKIN